ncbi:glucose 1-dehydrogenase [Anaeromyxobacter oryzae]|uniref:Glucose dehydrogenase n=1 Tax=Anaeromyxobacter oryzae TaxID=2918170 RepID=A0ABM7WSD4_9BACT|nr:glucose 1-dehydrogenase [Anaeromyxobacter oryzae]BDG02343.1 glucose dehydrogenase [Anaeromyxobacter oryzae]
MRAVAVYPQSREVRIIDHPEPRLAQGSDVLARVLEVGICGTDREIARFEYGAPPPGDDHLVLGHESLTEVVEVGPEVRGLAPGDLAVPMVRRPCPVATCTPCRHGRADFCFTGEYEERGINRLHGYMTERIVDDARWFVRVPRTLRQLGVLVEPLTVAEKGIIQALETLRRFPWFAPEAVQRREHGVKAVVIGAGAVGLLGAMALRARGFEVWLWSLEPEGGPQASLVESFGARYRSTSGRPLADLALEIGRIGLIFEATGAAPVAFQAMPLLGPNGIFCLTGVPGRKGPIPIDAATIMKSLVLRNQLFLGTVNAGPDAFRAAVEDLGVFAEQWPHAIERVVSTRHALDEVPRALVEPPTGTKSVVRIG